MWPIVADPRLAAGRTALHLACAKGCAEVVELLLAAGASPAAKDSLGCSPLLEAVKAGQEQCIAVLLRHRAPLGLDRNQSAALLCTCTAGSDIPKLRWAAWGLGVGGGGEGCSWHWLAALAWCYGLHADVYGWSEIACGSPSAIEWHSAWWVWQIKNAAALART